MNTPMNNPPTINNLEELKRILEAALLAADVADSGEAGPGQGCAPGRIGQIFICGQLTGFNAFSVVNNCSGTQ